MRILGTIAAGMTLVVAIVAVLAIWALQQRSEARRRTATLPLSRSPRARTRR